MSAFEAASRLMLGSKSEALADTCWDLVAETMDYYDQVADEDAAEGDETPLDGVNVVISVRLSHEQFVRLRRVSREAGMSTLDWMKALVLSQAHVDVA